MTAEEGIDPQKAGLAFTTILIPLLVSFTGTVAVSPAALPGLSFTLYVPWFPLLRLFHAPFPHPTPRILGTVSLMLEDQGSHALKQF